MLLTSNLAVILLTEFNLGMPDWWPWIHVFGLLTIFLLTLVKTMFKPLRGFVLVMLTIFLLGFGGGWNWGLVPYLRTTAFWIDWTNSMPWALSELGTHILRLIPAIAVLALLILMGLKRSDFFLIKGDIHAEVEPSRLLGMKKPEPWTRTGSIFAAVFTIGTFIFLYFAEGFPTALSFDILLLIPVILLIAMMNSFNEEFTLRAAPLSVLWKVIGKEQALLITTVYFGLGHYYGVPNGALGVLLSAFLGWFLGKSLIETRGFFWAWLIHFLPDVVIFTFFVIMAL
jgi:hypothetical protein